MWHIYLSFIFPTLIVRAPFPEELSNYRKWTLKYNIGVDRFRICLHISDLRKVLKRFLSSQCLWILAFVFLQLRRLHPSSSLLLLHRLLFVPARFCSYLTKMCEDSSSNNVANPSESQLGYIAVDEVEAEMDCDEEDVTLNGKDEYHIDGMEDIGMVRFELLSGEDFLKFHFADNGVDYDFYNTYGLVSGFSIRKSKIGKNVAGDVIRQNFVCSSQGYRQVGMIENRRREPKSITRYGCEAGMRIRLNQDNGRWVVSYFNDDHNHSLMGAKYTGSRSLCNLAARNAKDTNPFVRRSAMKLWFWRRNVLWSEGPVEPWSEAREWHPVCKSCTVVIVEVPK
ncbi:hypothetical protein RIF29_00452 [Crotalaria pallida]|uniref:FAR1 domain-containing protein n=1 Tax=Crotalaria pallida TaxID=3830 RepID=A0AAN9IW52_CROPI